eukprot:scaffold1843_cov143-Skeletonema_menzelii.AAC.20
MLLCIAFLLLSFSATAELLSTDQLDTRFTSPNLAPPGKNMNGTSVTTNFVRAYNEKQLLLLMPITIAQFEKPASPTIVKSEQIWWCADLTFSNFGGDETVAAGVQGYVDDPTVDFSSVLGISTVYVEQTNVFEFVGHRNTENMATRFWDDGRKAMPLNMWVTHDGVQTDNAHQVIGQFVWLSADEAAGFIGVNAADLTPERFSNVYTSVWNNLYNNSLSTSKEEMAKNNTASGNNSADESTSTSGARRKLGWIDARLMALVLRVFGM